MDAGVPQGEMMRGETGPDFIEALARGLDVIRAFGPNRPTMTLSEVAAGYRACSTDSTPDVAYA